MKRRVLALVFYSLYWLFYFYVARLFFIVTHYHEASSADILSLLATFLHGLKLDISATAYILILPFLLIIPGIFLDTKWYRPFIKWYTYIIVIVSSIIVVSDTVLYKYWGFRMDYTPLMYIKTPKDAMASVTTFQIAATFLTVVLMSLLFIIFYRKFIHKFFTGFEKIKLWIPAVALFLLLWGALIIPIRGGVGTAPINAGSAYFSKNMFINHTAINVVWNFVGSIVNEKPVSNPYVYLDPQYARTLVDSLVRKSGTTVKVLKNTRPDILMIVLESFGSPMIGPLGGDPSTTPCFDRYIGEGILFTRFYSSGFRTDKAMPAILNGYPAQPAESIIKDPKKTQTLPGIVEQFNQEGYHSSFWYGGDINFANFNSYIINSGFSTIISKDNFSGDRNSFSSWGVHDHILLNALKDSLKSVKEPFFCVTLTLSSHEPFAVPMAPVFNGNDEVTKFRNSIYYTDKSLGAFLDWAKQQKWWDNTLVILVADHYRRHSSKVMAYTEDIFKIPMLWLGGALAVHGVRIDKVGSQVDIPLTLLHQLDLDGNYPFGKDLLSEQSGSYAFYTYNEGFGFITDSSKYIYDHKLGKPVLEEGKSPELAGEYGKAYLQVLYDDFLKR